MKSRGLWCLALSLLVFFGCVSRVEALGAKYGNWFKRNLTFIVAKHPRYVFGGSGSDLTSGLDCSGYIFRAAKWSGMPVRRTTARRMALGEGGWIGRNSTIDNACELDLVWWTFKATRPNGHIGAIFNDSRHVTHASSSRGVVVDRLQGVLIQKITKVRRLTIGDARIQE